MMKLESEKVHPSEFCLGACQTVEEVLLVEKTIEIMTILKLMNYKVEIMKHYKDKTEKHNCQIYINAKNDKTEHIIRFILSDDSVRKMSYSADEKENWEQHFTSFIYFPRIDIGRLYIELSELDKMIELSELIKGYI